MTHMVKADVLRQEWALAAQVFVFGVTLVSAALFVTGLFITLPVSTGALIVGIMAKPELGRFRVAVIVLAAVGILLAVGWMLLSLDVAGLTGTNGPAVLSQGTVVD